MASRYEDGDVGKKDSSEGEQRKRQKTEELQATRISSPFVLRFARAAILPRPAVHRTHARAPSLPCSHRTRTTRRSEHGT